MKILPNKKLMNLFILAFGTMSLELSLIRLIDSLFWPGATFIGVAVVLFAFGASGYLAIKQKSFVVSQLAQCLFPILAFFSIWVFKSFEINFILTAVILTVPFLFSGYAVAYCLEEKSTNKFYLYLWDLVGLSLGGVMGLFIIPKMDPVQFVYVISVIIVIYNSVIYIGRKRLMYINALLIIILVVFNSFNTEHSFLSPRITKYTSGKKIKKQHIEYSSWNAISKIDIIDMKRTQNYLGIYPGSNVKYLFYDGGTLGSNIYKFDGNYKKLRENYLENLPQNYLRLTAVLAHYLKRDTDYSAFLIGVGSGQEVKAARMYGAKDIVANELIPEVIKLGKTTYSNYNGGIFLGKNIKTVAGDGRIALRKEAKKFDVIQIFSNYLSSTFARSKSFFSISYLLTVEAFDEYYSYLKEDGILQINNHGSDLILKIARTAWEGQSKSNFSNHIIKIKNKTRQDLLTTIIFKKSVWSKNEIQDIKELLNKHPTDRFALDISGSEKKTYQKYPTDQKPFFSFFYEYKKRHPIIVKVKIIASLLLLLLVMVLLINNKERGVLKQKVYFALLGGSFVFVQLSFGKAFMQFIEYPNLVHVLCVCILPLAMAVGCFMSNINSFFEKPHYLCLAPLFIIIFGFYYEVIFREFEYLSFMERYLLAVGIVFGIGLTIGSYFPLGMKLSKDMSWNWLANGLGASFGIFCVEYLQFNVGISFSIISAGAAYGVLILLISYCNVD